jgi:Fur family ferric uptake transcriptional regulator
MTAPPTVSAAVDALRARGLRVSSARRLLLQALYAAPGPVRAEELAAMTGDLASAYRNLDVLERAGLVRHVHLGHGPGLYAPASPREYAVCETCGAVHELAADAADVIREAVRERCGYHVGFGHFPLIGRCPGCASAAAEPSERVA